MCFDINKIFIMIFLFCEKKINIYQQIIKNTIINNKKRGSNKNEQVLNNYFLL